MKHIAILSLVLLCGCSTINEYLGFQDDNMVEEYLEERIENGIGVDLDLTPFSPERS